MLRLFMAVLAVALAAACSPTFNWRQVRPEGTALQALLPCKPDRAERTVSLAGRESKLQALGCEAGGATFAVLLTDVGDPTRAGISLDHWQRATLATIRASTSQAQPFVPAGAPALPQSLRVSAQGQRPDGTPVRSEAAYFARGSLVVQAVVYARELEPQLLEPFFQGLGFQ